MPSTSDATTGLFRSPRTRKLALIVVGPLAGVFYAHWRFSLWFITRPERIDPWIYWGTGENLEYAKTHFVETYYYRRWTLILPNNLAQHIFSPLYAQLVIRSLLLFGVLVAVGGITWICTKSLFAASLAIIGLSSNEYLVLLIGESHNEGTGVFLIAVGLLCVVAGIGCQNRRTWLLSCLSGLCFGLATISYQFTIYVFPAVFVLVPIGRSWRPWSRSLTQRIQLIAAAIVGFLVALGLDLWVGRLLGTPWENLLTYSQRISRGLRAEGAYSVPRSVFLKEIVLGAKSYLLPAVALLLAYTATLRRHSMTTSLASKLVIRLLLFWSLLFFVTPLIPGMSNTLYYPHTNVYLVWPLCIGLAVVTNQFFLLGSSRVPKNSAGSYSIGILFVGALAIICCWKLLSVPRETTTGIYLLICLSLLIVVFLRWSTGHLQAINTGMYLLLIASFISSSIGLAESVETRWAPEFRNSFASRADASAFLSELSSSTRQLTSLANRDSRRIWLIDTREHSGWSTNISALYGLYSAAVVGYPPSPVDCNQLNWIVMFPNSTIVVLGETNKNKATELVRDLTKECSPVSLTFRLKDRRSQSVWLDIAALPTS